MPVIAKLNYLRIAPRKVRLVADLIRGKTAEEAQTILNFAIKKSAWPILKLLRSALSNAKNNFQLEESNLYISKIAVDEGPKFKRFFPRARGQAYEIQKKTSHVTIVLDEVVKKARKKVKKAKEAEVKSDEVVEKIQKTEKPKFKLRASADRSEGKEEKKLLFAPRAETQKPRIEKGLRRIFRRKAF